MKPQKKHITCCLLLLLLLNTGCKTLKEADISRSHTQDFLSPLEFIHHPASVVLLSGDTLKGSFTKMRGSFYMIHENKDSNIYREKMNYPVSDYYKKTEAEEISAYTVKGQTYESVILVTDLLKNDMGSVPEWKTGNISFAKRISPGGSKFNLYLMFLPYGHDGKNKVLSDILFPADSIFEHRQYNVTYCVHFPDDRPRALWDLSSMYLGKAIKTKLAGLFINCPGLASLALLLKNSHKGQSPLEAIMQSTGNKKGPVEPVLIDMLSKYSNCLLQPQQ